MEEEGKLKEALNEYQKIFNYTDTYSEMAYQKGKDVDLLFRMIKKLKEELK